MKKEKKLKVNKELKQKNLESTHLNHMGEISFDISNPIGALRMVSASSFFGEPSYYDKSKKSVKLSDIVSNNTKKLKLKNISNEVTHTLKAIASLNDSINPYLNSEVQYSTTEFMESIIDKALDFNIEETLKFAVELRNAHLIRTTPQIIMVRAANHANSKGTQFISTYANEIIARPDESAVQLSYQLSSYGKPIPNSLKKAWAKKLASYNDFTLSKYKNGDGIHSLQDVVNICHPKSESINKLMRNELKLDNIEHSTWESIISKEGSNEKTWIKALDSMGHMALLRNIRNLISNGVDPDLFISKLIGGVEDGKQLPFRYLTAYNSLPSDSKYTSVQNALNDCLNKSIVNIPSFKGKTYVLTDNSGSALGQKISSLSTMNSANIGNLMAVMTALKSDGESYVGAFGDRLSEMKINKQSNILSSHKEIEFLGKNVGQATENGLFLFLNRILTKKEHFDNIFIYSDLQCGHGTLYGSNIEEEYSLSRGKEYINVPKMIKEYHKKVNPNCKFFLVQISGYDDTIVPEYYNNVYMLSGWSDQILKFAAEMNKF